MFGRHFDENDFLMSKVKEEKKKEFNRIFIFCLKISRESIDVVKDHFRDDMQKSDWQLMIELKKIFNIL
jgi:translation initiation factor 5B